ncbi:RHD3/Sey1 [Amanita rubescens]|nr:RHD3/Sey1 [Amanita rubescens]
MPAIKLINQQGELQRNLDAKIKRWSLNDGHKVVTAFGSTFDYKNAFLNLVFGTDFQNRDDNEGVWLCGANNAIILNVKNRDSKMSYSVVRKCALLSVIFSDVLIFHITNIRYGLPIHLIKPIFEVAIGLFSKMTPRVIDQTLLLFVVTPIPTHSLSISQIQTMLIADLERVWAEQSKPADHRLYDYFDVSFVIAPYLSMREWAGAEVSRLKARFLDKDCLDYAFKPRYQKKIAIDKLGLCMERLWLQLNTEYENIDLSVFVIEN